MRRIKKIFKFISYTLLFLIVAIGSAYGVITMSLNNANRNGNKKSGSAESSVPEEITNIINGFTNSSYIEAGLTADIITSSQNIQIRVSNGKVDLSQGLDNLVVDADLTVDMLSLDNQIDLKIQYKNGTIFLDGFNNKFKLETENLISSVVEITNLLNIEMPNIDGLDMGAIDVNALLGALKVADEVETETGVLLNIEIPAIDASINLECNKDYKLTKVSIPSLNFNGIEISLDGQFDYPEEVIIEEVNTEEYVNLSSVLEYSKNLSVLTNKTLAFDFDVRCFNQMINGEIILDLNTLSFKAGINSGNANPSILLIDNVVYLEIGNLYAKFDLDDLSKLQPVLDKFNINFSLQSVIGMIEEIKTNGIQAIVGLLSGKELDFTNIDLSVMEQVEKDNNSITIKLKNIGQISLLSDENGLKDIIFNSKNIVATLTTKEAHNFTLSTDKDNYVDLAKLSPIIDKMTDLIKGKNIQGNATIKYKDMTIALSYSAIIDDNLFAQVDLNLFGKNVRLIVKDKQIYISFSNTLLKLDTNNMADVLDTISKCFDSDSFNIVDKISKLFDKNKSSLYVKTFVEKENGVEIKLYDDTSIILENKTNSIELSVKGKDFNLQSSTSQAGNISIPTINENAYTNIESLLPLIENISNYLKDESYYLKYEVKSPEFSVNGGLNFTQDGLFMVCKITYGSTNGMIAISNGKLYIQAGKVNLVFKLSEYHKVETLLAKLGMNLDNINSILIDKIGMDIDKLIDVANGYDSLEIGAIKLDGSFGKIEDILSKIDVKLASNKLTLQYNQKLNAEVNFVNNMIKTINVNYDNITAQATILDNPYTYKIGKNYIDSGKLVDIASNFVQYFKDGKIAVSAQLSSSEDKAINANVQVDSTSTLKLSADITSNIKEDITASINIEDGMTYLNVNGMLIKISNNNLKEIVYIALSLFGIDTNVFDNLKNIDLNLDLSELKNYVPKLSISDISEIINMVKSFEKKSDNYVLTLDASNILHNPNAKNVVVTIVTNGSTVTAVKLENIYTSSSLDEKYDGEITFNNLLSFNKFDKTLSYIDISNSNELIKAIINMSQSKSFNIKGSVDLNGNLIGIKINKNIGFDIKINVTNDHKIEAYGEIGEIPTLVGVNNDVPYVSGDTNSGSNRYLKFYYKDGYVYLYRSESVAIFFGASQRSYEKCVKVSLDTLLYDPLKFVQYSIGLTDKIMDEIRNSTNKSKERTTPINYSNIIKSFTVSSNSYKLVLNMAEITNDTKLDKLEITLKTSKDKNSKDYISNASFSLSLPLSKVFSMKLSSSDIKLVNYNETLDMQPLYNYVNNYGYAEGQYWEASKGEWTMIDETNGIIVFETNSRQTVDTMVAKAGTDITLPTLNSHVVIGDGYRTYRTFAGWYSDATFKNKYTSTKMPGRPVVLYAKWNERVEKIYDYDDIVI